MSGHNRWSSIKHKKGAADAKRGKIFTKIMKELTMSARIGGSDPTGNSRLRLAMIAAREQNMPKDNIDRAIKRGTGEIEGAELVECQFEGYGVNGVAILVEGTTDNINRTSAEIRSIFNKNGGNLGAQGSVAWMFEKKGIVLLAKDAVSEEQLMELTLSLGAEDFADRGDHWEVITEPASLEKVREGFDKAKIAMGSAEISMIPKNTVKLNAEDGRKILHLIEKLEDNDDVQKVHGNYEIPEEVMDKLHEDHWH